MCKSLNGARINARLGLFSLKVDAFAFPPALAHRAPVNGQGLGLGSSDLGQLPVTIAGCHYRGDRFVMMP